MRLHEMPIGVCVRVKKIIDGDGELEAKLREIGFAEDDDVEIVHYGPMARKPICVRLNQTLIALRAEEAAAIIVETSS